jgi:hypothetical protein
MLISRARIHSEAKVVLDLLPVTRSVEEAKYVNRFLIERIDQ